MSKVTWECNFVANGVPDEEAIEILTGIYKTGIRIVSRKVLS